MPIFHKAAQFGGCPRKSVCHIEAALHLQTQKSITAFQAVSLFYKSGYRSNAMWWFTLGLNG